MLAVVEIPAQDRVRDFSRSPKRQKEVHAFGPIEVVGPRLPALIVVGFGSVGEVSNVLDRHAATVKSCARYPGYIGSPVARIGWQNRRPPKRDDNHRK